jgi:glycosyltransferase involved in cell wall biosynthesis
LHIGFLTPEYPDDRKPEGGLGNYVRKISLELITRGLKVTVFVLAARKDSQQDAGVELRYIARARFHWRLKRNRFVAAWLELFELWLNARRMRSAVLDYERDFPLDIVQTPNYLIPGYFLRHNNFFPLVCRCSSYAPMLRSANGFQRKLPEAVADWMEARLVSEADGAFAPSQLVVNTYGRFEAVGLSLIRTPIEQPFTVPDDSVYRAMNGRKYLLYFGALNRYKGLDVLLKAVPEILAQNKELCLLFIGRNDTFSDEIRAMDVIKRSLEQYWQESRVVYFPSLQKAQLYPFIQHALGVIIPSRVDNYPNACLEAMALGIPVIGTRDSSLDEIIVDERTGFLAQNGDFSSLRKAIEKLLSLTDAQRKYMQTEIAYEMERITSEDRVGQLVNFYESVIQNFNQVRK